MTQSQTITAGRVVSMHYQLTLEGGQVVDSSKGADPLAYLHGAGNIVPGLEQAMEGKAPGDSFEVTVTPEEGYGAHREEAVQEVPRGAFPDDAALEAGVQFQATDQNQNPIMGTIEALDGDKVKVDFNHPLAGKTLNFAIDVVEVREATDEETQHGHVHGPGGHAH